jgi:hypothetical protein
MRQAKALCRCIAALAGDNVQNVIMGIAREEWGQFEQVEVFEYANKRPAMACLLYADVQIIVINGVTMREQVDEITSGYYAGPQTGVNPVGCHRFYSALANQIVADIILPNVAGHQILVMGGHSLGGAVCNAIANLWKGLDESYVASFCSFGSPKPGNATFAAMTARSTSVRHMNGGDPVPLAFPDSNQAPIIQLATVASTQRNIGAFVQPAEGIQWTNGNTYIPAVFPVQQTGITAIDFASWLLTVENDVISPHRVQVYLGNLVAYCGTFPTNMPAPTVIGGDAETPKIIDPSLSNTMATAVTNAIQVRSSSLNVSTTFVPPEQEFVAVKSGKKWGVQFRGEWVTWCNTRKRASHLAAVGNNFLREYLKAGIAYPDTLTDQLSDWMIDAETGQSGIVPMLQTTLP